MKWVALVIAVGIAIYTWLTLEFRKPENPGETWQEQRLLAEVEILKKAGWDKSVVPYRAAGEFPASQGNVKQVPQPAIVEALRSIKLDPWYLPIEVTESSAPAEWQAGRPYTVWLRLVTDTGQKQIGGFYVFRKDTDIVLVPRWERVPADPAQNTRTHGGRLLFQPGDVPPGEYTVIVAALKACATWHLTVRAGEPDVH